VDNKIKEHKSAMPYMPLSSILMQ